MINWLVLMLVIVEVINRGGVRDKESFMREVEIGQGRWIQECRGAQLGLQFLEVSLELSEKGKLRQEA